MVKLGLPDRQHLPKHNKSNQIHAKWRKFNITLGKQLFQNAPWLLRLASYILQSNLRAHDSWDLQVWASVLHYAFIQAHEDAKAFEEYVEKKKALAGRRLLSGAKCAWTENVHSPSRVPPADWKIYSRIKSQRGFSLQVLACSAVLAADSWLVWAPTLTEETRSFFGHSALKQRLKKKEKKIAIHVIPPSHHLW